jgi:hypothetical protein
VVEMPTAPNTLTVVFHEPALRPRAPAATVRPPFGEADLEAAGVVRARITMLTWCGHALLNTRESLTEARRVREEGGE